MDDFLGANARKSPETKKVQKILEDRFRSQWSPLRKYSETFKLMIRYWQALSISREMVSTMLPYQLACEGCLFDRNRIAKSNESRLV
jgi:hypothetical protein